MFYRVEAGDTQRAGTGLGLAICRGLVEAHGGATIEFSLPLADQPSMPGAAEEEAVA